MESESLSDELERISRTAEKADKYVSDLKKILEGKEIPAKVQENINSFDKSYSGYLMALESGYDEGKVFSSASNLVLYLTSISARLKDISFEDERIKYIIANILDASKILKGCIDKRKVVFTESDLQESKVRSKNSLAAGQALRKKIDMLDRLLQDSEDRHEKKQSTIDKRLAEIGSSLDMIEKQVNSKLEAVDSLYSSAKEDLEKKQKGVDELLGTISASVIAGDYETSATLEKKMADWLRIASLGFMVVIALVVGFSLYETTSDTFKWENSLFRLFFTIILSVPAAYLARESAKHRQQQYAHLQTSLDLKAITPYLASLPIEEQHRLKSEIANRIFAPKSYLSNTSDAYPVNTQEILMRLLDKLEFKSSNEKEANANKDG